MPTKEEIAAYTPEQQAAYYKGLYEAETANHAVTQEALTTEVAAHVQTKVDAETEVGQLSQQLASATKAAAQGYVSVEINGVNHKVIGKRFQIDGEVVTVEDLLKNQELLEKLVEKGSGILVPID